MNSYLSKLIFEFGAHRRNPTLRDSIVFLQKTQSWSIEDLRKLQFEKCKILLDQSYRHSQFYQQKFDNAGFVPSRDFVDLADLDRIPITTKSELIEYNQQVHTDLTFSKTFFSETSGTSGKALLFYKNEEWDSLNRASMLRGYGWYGVQPWERNGYFWGYNFDLRHRLKTKLLDTLQNRFRLFSFDPKSIKQFAFEAVSASYLHGYSSMIYEVAKLINSDPDLSSRAFKLKLVKGTSEKIFDQYQEEVKKAFGQKIISEYGAAESGLIAFECPHGQMHVVMENVIVEEKDHEIIVTNLNSFSFPIIRYSLGDYISLHRDVSCPCGMEHDVVSDILGRVGKTVVGHRKTYPSLTFYYIFKNLAFDQGIKLNYQVIQAEAGKLDFRIEQQMSEYEKIQLIKEISKYFDKDIDVSIIPGTSLHAKDGKLRDFISHLG